MRLFFLSFPLPNNICLVYRHKTLLFLNSNGGISHRLIEPTVNLCRRNNMLYIRILINAPTSAIKHFLSFLKIQVAKQLAVFARGYKKQIAIKGLGYRAEFFVSKNRQFLNFKISYSHKVAVPIHLGVFLLRLKNNLILFESKDQGKLSSVLNLLFRLKPYNVYKQKGIFLKQAPLFIPKPSKKKV
jgi:ribosomal protein L6P/L9E